LLPLAKRFHAAATIQRAFRKKLGRLVLKQRVEAMRVARECAEVVMEKQRVEAAAVVVQRAWRAIVKGRVEDGGSVAVGD
jgi:abnormal spindle-like microcephaly-associated protein